ncbi:MAG: dTDP-4-amino-4,6-dideoxygalactose transaminase [bacterium]|nr:dTDP-4-amino-4,6-dideoxygalactose transaminase [bacterium]
MKIYPLNKPDWGIKEIIAVTKYILRGKGGGGNGEITRRVEKKIGEILNIPYVFLTSSGTSALELGLYALQLQPGYEVITSSFTFVSTATAIIRQGGIPAFVDIEINTMNINPDLIEDKINEKTKVIIPVHYGGLGCKMEKILNIAQKYNLSVIEDAAHAFGSKYKEKYLGTWGDIGCFSFHETKNIVCGEGGAIVTSNEGLSEKIDIIREKGTNRSKFLKGEIEKYEWISEGSNFLLSDILAVLLEQQINKLEIINKKRKEIAEYMYNKLQSLSPPLILPNKNLMEETNWHIFAIRVPNQQIRSELLIYLNKNGIKASFHYLPLHLSPYIKTNPIYKYKNGDLPITESVASTIIRLPLNTKMKYKDVDYIVYHIEKFFKGEKCCENRI